jgi:two-component system sensor histidine kinase HydH
LAAVLVLSLGLILVTTLNYRTAVRVADETLQNQGVAISMELAAEARSRGAQEAPELQTLLAEQRRREVAFLAIVDRDGIVLAHTNPRLVGTSLDDAAFRGVRETGQLHGAAVMLGTGEEVYELTLPFHVPPAGQGAMMDPRHPRFRILRIALHTAPARQIVHQAQLQVLFAGVFVLILLGLSGWQLHTLRRYLALQEEAARQERLAALGGMAAVLAHEIRNPLGAIKGLAQFLGEKQAGDSTQAEMTRAIAGEASRLERLVNDLLTYARPRSPDRHPLDLEATLREVVALAQAPAEAAGVTVRLDEAERLAPVLADRDQVQQLFGNLLLNAIQAMPAGGTATLIVRAARAGVGNALPEQAVPGDGVLVRVEDTGSGIPEEDLARIFEPFYTTRSKGTGLGLAICRQIAEAHGWTIGVARTGPQGTVFEVKLPRERSPHG